ncbi:uncharacterized protein EMH_0046130 [Eimeria mitis]|uniref:Transcription initiation factor TFIID subunit 10 n=1 Tax=Eimeria mitis TaxID=44415 RepID=U6KJ50_9EIME|nr:uncharacterized protein EMH_0046130 [Eimeria mitis]CDJ36302.1 hypothetical protein, conserved [Eimeria mitis]
MDKSVLDLEEILGPRDEQLLQKLSAHEPAILDEVVNYHLARVGCTTTDTAATRLLSVAVQVVFEKAIDEAKLIHATSRGDVSSGSRRTDGASGAQGRATHRRYGHLEDSTATAIGSTSALSEVKELDVESLCKALQRNGTLPVGPTFDLLLQPLGQEKGKLSS